MLTTPKSIALGIGALVVVTCVAYLPALNGGFIFDDSLYLTSAPLVKASDGLYRFWFTNQAPDYYPVSNSSLWIEWRLWGMNPTGYRITNLILHIATALMIWRVISQLAIPGGFLAAVLYALHPVNVESVAWIAQRKDILAALFFWMSVLFFVKEERGERSSQNGMGAWYWLSLAAFVIAMLSKGSVGTLPVVLLGIVAWQRRLKWWDVVRIAPFVVVAAALSATVVWFQTRGTDVVIRHAGLAERLAGAAAAVWFYLSKALLPIEQSLIYPLWRIRIDDVLWWLPFSMVAFVTLALAWETFWRKSPGAKALLFGWGFFCVALAPMLGFRDVGFMQYSLVSDHYQHVAIVGVVALAAAAWSLWRESTRGASRAAATSIGVAVVAACLLLTARQSRLYADPIRLYWATLERNPASALAHYNLSVELNKARDTKQALAQCLEAVRLKPDYIDARNNLGILLSRAGRTDEAIACLQESLRIQPGNPITHFNLGDVLSELNRPSDAAEQFQRAVQLQPDYAEAWANLAATYGDLNRWNEAQAAADNALKFGTLQGLPEVTQGIEMWRRQNAAKLAKPTDSTAPSVRP